jgi:tryptophan synthase beta subunit
LTVVDKRATAGFRRELGLVDPVVVVAGGVVGVGIFANPSNVARVVLTGVNAAGVRAGRWTNDVLIGAKLLGMKSFMSP